MASIRYPFFHWITTLLVGPLFWFAGEFVTDGDATWGLYGAALLFGGLFSLPVFLFYWAAYHWLRRSWLPSIALKAIFNVALIASAGVTMNWIGGSLMPALFWCYSAAIVVGSLPLRMERTTGRASD